MDALRAWKERAKRLRAEARALFFALGDRRVPWYARALAGAVVAYAFSPIDLIPDFIPVLGLLDDLIIIPAGMYLVFKLVPAEVMAEYRAREEVRVSPGARGWLAAAVIALVWAAVMAAIVLAVWR